MTSFGSKQIVPVALAFALLAAALISFKPLTMDEVLTLVVARQPTFHQALIGTAEHTGNAPLGFLIERASLTLTGYSVWLARLPSALFGVASVIATGFLARKLRVASPLLAAALFAAFPLTFRYTLEVRPYAPALFFSVLLTLLFLELSERPAVPIVFAYALAAVLALYTQPFAALVCGAHFLWSAMYKQWRTAAVVCAAGLFAAATFAPWFLWARPLWTDEITARFIRFAFTVKTPLMLVRELTGAGYWGVVILFLLCALGAMRSGMERRTLSLLVLLIAVPLAGALLADAVFNYFLAARQFLWVLPALAILAVSAWDTSPRATQALLTAALLICGIKTYKYFTQPEPDWEAAARAITMETDRGACFRVAPSNARDIFVYFAPQLAKDPEDCRTVVTAAIPGFSADAIFAELAQQRYIKLQTTEVGETSLTIFRK